MRWKILQLPISDQTLSHEHSDVHVWSRYVHYKKINKNKKYRACISLSQTHLDMSANVVRPSKDSKHIPQSSHKSVWRRNLWSGWTWKKFSMRTRLQLSALFWSMETKIVKYHASSATQVTKLWFHLVKWWASIKSHQHFFLAGSPRSNWRTQHRWIQASMTWKSPHLEIQQHPNATSKKIPKYWPYQVTPDSLPLLHQSPS